MATVDVEFQPHTQYQVGLQRIDEFVRSQHGESYARRVTESNPDKFQVVSYRQGRLERPFWSPFGSLPDYANDHNQRGILGVTFGIEEQQRGITIEWFPAQQNEYVTGLSDGFLPPTIRCIQPNDIFETDGQRGNPRLLQYKYARPMVGIRLRYILNQNGGEHELAYICPELVQGTKWHSMFGRAEGGIFRSIEPTDTEMQEITRDYAQIPLLEPRCMRMPVHLYDTRTGGKAPKTFSTEDFRRGITLLCDPCPSGILVDRGYDATNYYAANDPQSGFFRALLK